MSSGGGNEGVPEYLKTLENSLKNLMPSTASNVTVSEGKTVQMDVTKTQTPAVNPSALTAESLVSKGLFGTSVAATAGSAATKRLRFMLVGTHCHQFTGYSKVTYGIVRQLSKLPWLQVTHFAFQRHPQPPPNYRPYPPNIDIIDAASIEKPAQQGFGFAQLPDAIRRKKPDVVLIYNDMTVITKFLEEIRKSGLSPTFKIWLYVDQVYTTQLQMYLDVINRDAERVFVFSKMWKKCLKDQGINRPIDVIRHGFDKDMFSPMKKEEARKMLNLPQDMFLFMSLNRNQPRKRYDILIMAFVELICKYPTKPLFLMCVCDKGEKGGWWLFEIYARELKLRGVPVEMFGGRLMITQQDMVFRDEDINVFYNAADVICSSPDGEGCGLTALESLGIGNAGIVATDLIGHRDFLHENNSVLVSTSSRGYNPTSYSSVGGEWNACSPKDFCIGMEVYVNDKEKLTQHKKKGREDILKLTWEASVVDLVKRLEEVKKEQEDESS